MRIILILAISAIAFMSCRDGGISESSNTSTTTNTTTNNTANPADQDNQSINSSTQDLKQTGENGSSEFHYICANNCEGSSANAAGNCSVCGEELVHNTAFHSGGGDQNNTVPQPVTSDNNAFTSKITPLGDQSTGSTTAPAVTGDPSFHYTCSAGCGGGGNAQGPCPSCGADLAHNAAFHSQGAGAAQGAPAGQPSSQKYPSVFNSPNAVPSAAPIPNTSGQSHYICSAGCGGGGNAQGSCPSCGAELAHNAAFHQ